MLNERLSYRDYLHLFDVVSSRGEKIDGVFEYSNIKTWHDFDGYTCWLSYKDLMVTLMFHSKFQVEYTKNETLEEFSKLFILLTSKKMAKE